MANEYLSKFSTEFVSITRFRENYQQISQLSPVFKYLLCDKLFKYLEKPHWLTHLLNPLKLHEQAFWVNFPSANLFFGND